ncbi:glycerophosphodiester phosphodiesterase family protein [Halomonas borealis]|uniref:glycerophosphodiester phosphodiesterase family protein n=1 Tax=Halomonas borealis TaxID=2508710 RepID=UPI0010A08975|nr:glycerophosphodiester phosphodiesterase family protein [Halomonas borealis]
MPLGSPPLIVPRLIAHRGLSAHAPENTLAAVRAAAAAGIRWVELDVQLLGDGTPVIWHDRDIARCSDGRERLSELTLATARRRDAGGWFAPAFAGEPMATLDEMLALLVELGMGVNLELKVNRGHDPLALAEAAVPALMAALPAERRLVSSFDARALRASRALAGPERLALGALFDRVPHDWQARAEAVQAVSVHANWKPLKAERARAIKAAGYALLCFTANDPRAFAPRWDWGVDAVISDDPTRFL